MVRSLTPIRSFADLMPGSNSLVSYLVDPPPCRVKSSLEDVAAELAKKTHPPFYLWNSERGRFQQTLNLPTFPRVRDAPVKRPFKTRRSLHAIVVELEGESNEIKKRAPSRSIARGLLNVAMLMKLLWCLLRRKVGRRGDDSARQHRLAHRPC